LHVAELLIGSPESEHVAVSVLGRAYPNATDFWDGNWLPCRIRIRAGAWDGTFGASLRADEFVTFRDGMERLYETLDGSATFETMEGWLELRMVGDGIGHVAISGVAKDRVSIGGSTLSFVIPDIDQTYLPAVIDQLRAIESAFPVVAAPPKSSPAPRPRRWRRP
jgi:hypothetical protein